MQSYIKIVQNLPPEVPCRPVVAGFEFDKNQVRIVTCRNNSGIRVSLKDLTEDQIKIAAGFGGMMCEIAELGDAGEFEDMIKANAAELKTQ